MREQVSDQRARHIMMGVILRASIAEQIRALRASRKLTQAELAKGMNTTQSAIARLEDPHGEWMNIETLNKVAHFFDVGLLITFAPWSKFLELFCGDRTAIPPSFGQEAL